VAVCFTETMVAINQNRWNHITATIKSHDTNKTFTFFTVCVLQFSLNYLLLLLVLLVLSTCNYIRHHRINQRQAFHQTLFCSVLKDDNLECDFKQYIYKELGTFYLIIRVAYSIQEYNMNLK